MHGGHESMRDQIDIIPTPDALYWDVGFLLSGVRNTGSGKETTLAGVPARRYEEKMPGADWSFASPWSQEALR